MKTIQFTVNVREDGDIELKVPEGRDAGIIASFTDWLSKKVGRVKERHIGRNEGGVHVHDDGTVHHHH